MIWLLQQPVLIVGLLTVVVVVSVSVVGLIVFRRAVSHTRLESANAVSGQVFSLAGVLYAVLAAFVVVLVWEQFVAAGDAAEAEARAIGDLLRDSQGLPAEIRPQLQQSVIAYAQDVIDEEFPRMRRGEAIEHRSEHLDRVWDIYLQVQPVTNTETEFYDESIKKLNDLGSSRGERIATGESKIPVEMWILLIGGGAITMAFTYLFGTPDLVVHACAVGLTAALMGFVVFLIFALEHPFVGDIAVQPAAYVDVLEFWRGDSVPP